MLKRRVGSIFLAASMLAGMYAVPASAKTKVYEDAPVTLTLINETFEGCAADSSMGQSTSPVEVSGANKGTTINSYKGWANPLTIKSEEGGTSENKYASINPSSGAKLRIKNNSGVTQVKTGDIITVSFKFKSDYTKSGDAAQFIVNLNDNKKSGETGTMCRFVKGSNDWSGSDSNKYFANYPTQGGNQLVADKNDGRILNLFMGANRYSMNKWSSSFSSGNTYSTTGWNDVTITINTNDTSGSYGGEQTLKTEVKYTDADGNEQSSYFKGKYDADYTGDSDTTYDKITSINSLQFDSLEEIYNLTGNGADFDDIKVTLQTTESKLASVTSTLDGTIINETFNSCIADTGFGKNATTDPVKVTDADETTTVQAYKNWYTTPLTVKNESGNNNYASMNFGNGAILNIKNKSGSTPVKEGDIIKISFKVKDTTNTSGMFGRLIVNLNNNKNNSATGDNGKMSRYTGKTGKSIDDTKYSNRSANYPWINNGTDNDAKYKDGRIFNLNMGRHSYSMTSKNDDTYWVPGHKVGDSVWTDVTITINTKDAEYDNQQTLKAEASYIDSATNQQVSTYMKGLYDADYKGDSDETYDRITSIDSIQFDSYEYWHNDTLKADATADFDDIKVQVISPEFEIWGSATTVNNVEGTLDDEFIEGNELTVKASTVNSDNTLLVGVYDANGILINCTTAKAAEGNNIITAEGISTTGADTIKLFLWNNTSSIEPTIQSKTLTKYAGSVLPADD